MSKTLTPEQREAKREYEREYRKRRYHEDPEYRARKKATDAAWYARMVEEVKAHKLKHGCIRCGYKKCARALQFHHTDDNKEFTISGSKAIHKGREKLWAEIEKCEILCANCHAEEHDD